MCFRLSEPKTALNLQPTPSFGKKVEKRSFEKKSLRYATWFGEDGILQLNGRVAFVRGKNCLNFWRTFSYGIQLKAMSSPHDVNKCSVIETINPQRLFLEIPSGSFFFGLGPNYTSITVNWAPLTSKCHCVVIRSKPDAIMSETNKNNGTKTWDMRACITACYKRRNLDRIKKGREKESY